MINWHPESDFLVEYAAGSLSPALCVSVTTHLQFCKHCRSEVDSLQEVGGELMSDTDSVAVSGDLLDKIMTCVDKPAGDERHNVAQPAVGTYSTIKGSDDMLDSVPGNVRKLLSRKGVQWRFLSPSVKVAPIGIGETRHELALHRIRAGGTTPAHDHRGREITVVLSGSFSDENGIYREGDFIVRNPGDVHKPHAAKNEACLCLSVLEAPIALKGIKSVLNPFMKFSPS